jgi:dTDP-4-amino-4,6-dideoxygalactose transaminase
MVIQMKPYDIVEELERVVAEYAGSKYAVACDSCTNALLLALKYEKVTKDISRVILPCHTYVGVAYSCLNAGLKIQFEEYPWEGQYRIGYTNVIDSARRFTKGMYIPNTLYCLSAHWGKHLKIGRGGFILTDDAESARVLRIMRFDGRQAGVKPKDDDFKYPSCHCYMLPSEAAHGLMLMQSMPEYNPDIPPDGYADLSKYSIFKE